MDFEYSLNLPVTAMLCLSNDEAERVSACDGGYDELFNDSRTGQPADHFVADQA